MNRGTLKHRPLPPGSTRPDWEGYVESDGWRLQLIGWTAADGSINLQQAGRERIATTRAPSADIRPRRAGIERALAQLPAVDAMYRRGK